MSLRFQTRLRWLTTDVLLRTKDIPLDNCDRRVVGAPAGQLNPFVVVMCNRLGRAFPKIFSREAFGNSTYAQHTISNVALLVFVLARR